MKAFAVLAVGLAVPSWAGNASTPAPSPLSQEHVHPSGAFTFRTPEGWTLVSYGPTPQILEAKGDGVIVRFWYLPEEAGYDSLHIDCMTDRLAGPMDVDPRIKYDYDFLSGEVGARRFLDTAFVVTYDKDVMGHRLWRQRTLTLVGGGQSLCVIAHCPSPLWKKSKQMRAVLDGVVASIAFKPWP